MELVKIDYFIYSNELFVFVLIILATDNSLWDSEDDNNADDKLQLVNDDDNNTTTKSKPILIQVNEKDESSEEVSYITEPLKLRPNTEESDNKNMIEDLDDDNENVAIVVNNDNQRSLYDDSEYDA